MRISLEIDPTIPPVILAGPVPSDDLPSRIPDFKCTGYLFMGRNSRFARRQTDYPIDARLGHGINE